MPAVCGEQLALHTRDLGEGKHSLVEEVEDLLLNLGNRRRHPDFAVLPLEHADQRARGWEHAVQCARMRLVVIRCGLGAGDGPLAVGRHGVSLEEARELGHAGVHGAPDLVGHQARHAFEETLQILLGTGPGLGPVWPHVVEARRDA